MLPDGGQDKCIHQISDMEELQETPPSSPEPVPIPLERQLLCSPELELKAEEIPVVAGLPPNLPQDEFLPTLCSFYSG